MGLRIKTNTTALAAQRSVRNTQKSKSSVLEKLSSGQRINKSGDDAAGLAISEGLKANIRSSNQAKRNANDGISMIQVAEGGLNEISNILIRLRELSIQSASDTIGDRERSFTDKEFQNLTQEVERIAQTTDFNGTDLLNGEGEMLDFQVGINSSPETNRIQFDAGAANATASSLEVEGLTVASKEGALSNLDAIDNAIGKVSENRANLGALQNRLQSTVSNLDIQTENLAAANSRVRDADIAKQSSELAKQTILESASTSVLAQANASGQAALRLLG